MPATPELEALIHSFGLSDSPLLAEIRSTILAIDPTIEEGVKWNSLSFRKTEWFATLNARAKNRVEFVFHLGAKPKPESHLMAKLPQTTFLLWKSPDRAIVSFSSLEEFERCRSDFEMFVSVWIRHLS